MNSKHVLRLLVFVLLLAILSPSTSALDYDDVITLWTFDDTPDDSKLMHNLTLLNVSEYIPMVINNGINFSEDEQGAAYHNFTNLSILQEIKTIDLWYNPCTPSGSEYIWKFGNASNDDGLRMWHHHDGTLKVGFRTAGAGVDDWTLEPATVYNVDDLLHIVLVLNDTTGAFLYVNQSLVANLSSATDYLDDTLDVFTLGSVWSGGKYDAWSNGSVDHMVLTNYSYTWQDVNDSFNGGDGYNYFTTINFSFKDEATGLGISDVDVDIISDGFANTYNTGTWDNLTLYTLDGGDYTVRYSMTNATDTYPERYFYFTIADDAEANYTLYLVNGTQSTNVTATIYDTLNNLVEGAYIYVLRYFIEDNSYELVEIAETNLFGEAYLDLILHDEYYKFLIYYPWGTLRYSSIETILTDDTINFQIQIEDEVGEDTFKILDLDYKINYTNSTRNFKLTYVDVSDEIEEICLRVYRQGVHDFEQTNESCHTDYSAGSILINIPEINGSTWEARGYATVSGIEYYLGTATHKFSTYVSGTLGLFIIMILAVAFFGIGLMYDLRASIILVTIPLIFGSYWDLVPISIYIPIAAFLMAVVFAVVIQRGGE